MPYINRKNHSPFFLFPFSFLCILLLNASFLFFFPGTIPPRSSHSYFTKYIPLNIYFCLYIFGLKYEFYLSLLQWLEVKMALLFKSFISLVYEDAQKRKLPVSFKVWYKIEFSKSIRDSRRFFCGFFMHVCSSLAFWQFEERSFTLQYFDCTFWLAPLSWPKCYFVYKPISFLTYFFYCVTPILRILMNERLFWRLLRKKLVTKHLLSGSAVMVILLLKEKETQRRFK